MAAAQNRKQQEAQLQRKYQKYSKDMGGSNSGGGGGGGSNPSVRSKAASSAAVAATSTTSSKRLQPIATQVESTMLATEVTPRTVTPPASSTYNSDYSGSSSNPRNATARLKASASSSGGAGGGGATSWEDYDEGMYMKSRHAKNATDSEAVSSRNLRTASRGRSNFNAGASASIPLDEYGGDPSLRSKIAGSSAGVGGGSSSGVSGGINNRHRLGNGAVSSGSAVSAAASTSSASSSLGRGYRQYSTNNSTAANESSVPATHSSPLMSSQSSKGARSHSNGPNTVTPPSSKDAKSGSGPTPITSNTTVNSAPHMSPSISAGVSSPQAAVAGNPIQSVASKDSSISASMNSYANSNAQSHSHSSYGQSQSLSQPQPHKIGNYGTNSSSAAASSNSPNMPGTQLFSSTAASVASAASATTLTSANSNASAGNKRPPIHAINLDKTSPTGSYQQRGGLTISSTARNLSARLSPGSPKSAASSPSRSLAKSKTSASHQKEQQQNNTAPQLSSDSIPVMIKRLQQFSTTAVTGQRPPSPPKNISPDEVALWEAIQSAIKKQQEEANATQQKLADKTKSEITRLELVVASQETKLKKQERSPADRAAVEQMEKKLKETEEAFAEAKQEYDTSMRAIQRVMADLTSEKEQEQEEYELKLQQLERKYDEQVEKVAAAMKPPPPPPPTPPPAANAKTASASASSPSQAKSMSPPRSPASDDKTNNRITHLKAELMEAKKKATEARTETTNVQRELDKKTRRILNLERDIKTQKYHQSKHADEVSKLKSQIAELEKSNDGAEEKALLQSKGKEINNLRSEVTSLSQELETVRLEKEELEKELQSSVEKMEEAVLQAEAAAVARQKSEAAAEEARKLAAAAEASAAKEASAKSKKNNNDAEETKKIAEELAAKEQEVSSLAKKLERTKREHQDAASSLENAKKIITSLENANSSISHDLRGKLKAREEELSFVKQEAADRKRNLDTLATELRDLQTKQNSTPPPPPPPQQQQRSSALNPKLLAQQKALIQQLQVSVTGLQSAAVVHEVSSSTGSMDPTNVDRVGDILDDALIALQTVVKDSEQILDGDDDVMDNVTTVDSVVNSEVGRHIDSLIRDDREAAAKELRDENDQQRITISTLQDELRESQEAIKRLQEQQKRQQLPAGDNEIEMLRAEVFGLREQCATNMEVLTKKERELTVLKASLNIDDNDGGYISDDDDYDDEEDDASQPPPPPNSVTSPPRVYGASETEALATLLAAGGGNSNFIMPHQQSTEEVASLKEDLSKLMTERDRASRELQAERESLANAKMIISSLEQANKSMMEDLRSRLQDSNTAIASLLDKSMEHETTTKSLRSEVEQLQKEKAEVENKFEDEVQKLKDENTVLALRIQQASGGAKPNSPAEEKKEDSAVVTAIDP